MALSAADQNAISWSGRYVKAQNFKGSQITCFSQLAQHRLCSIYRVGVIVKIGELAKSSSCSVQTIQYSEKEGLISAPSRSEGNFRLYDKQTFKKLLFIKHCRSLGLTLTEIRQLIQLQALSVITI